MNQLLLLPLFHSRSFIVLLLLGWCFSACLKDKDGVSGGHASLAVVNLIVNGEPVTVSIDGSTITPAPVAFGAVSQANGSPYLQVASGIHSLRAVSGTRTVLDNNVSFQPGSYHTLLLYDTLKSDNSIKTQLLTDGLTPVDTVAKARYFQCIPADTVTISLVRDTGRVNFTRAYIGSTTVSGAFDSNLREGSYQVDLLRNNTSLFQLNSFSAVRGKLYTFIVKGIPGGTGSYAESILVLRNN